jgi:hypothetical protein
MVFLSTPRKVLYSPMTYAPGSLEHALEISETLTKCTGMEPSLFPVRRKRPFAGTHGHLDAVAGRDILRKLWGATWEVGGRQMNFRDADGVGIATGEPSGLFALDVDTKDGKVGAETLTALEREHGEIEPTVEAISGTGGRHLFFRFDPRGATSAGKLGADLDVRSGGGYIVAAGSRHDVSSALYAWNVERHPDDVALKAAPEWLLALAQGAGTEGATILEEGELAEMIRRMLAMGWEEMAPKNGRRDFHPDYTKRCRASWYPPDRYWPEGRLTSWSSTPGYPEPGTYGARSDPGRQLLDDIEAYDAAFSKPKTGQGFPTLPDEFFLSSPTLMVIQEAAWSRGRSREAVLLAVMARVAAVMNPQSRLDVNVGSSTPLNWFTLLVAPPGIGKSTAATVAEELFPFGDITGLKDWIKDSPGGSGEGLIEAYFGDVKADGKVVERRQVRSHLFCYMDEGAMMSEVNARNGSTLFSTLRSMWTGATAGQDNAAADRRRVLRSCTYSFGLVVGLQDIKAGPLLADHQTGTPQRFFFCAGIDPNIPRPGSRPRWPGSVDLCKHPIGDGHQVHVDSEITHEIQMADWAKATGQARSERLDEHAGLMRLRAAGLLAALDGRWANVMVGHWQKAGVLMDYHRAVRACVEAVVREATEQKDQYATSKRAKQEVIAADAVESHQLEKGAIKIKGHVAKTPGITVRDLHRRAHTTEEQLDEAVRRGWVKVRSEPGQGTPKRVVFPLKPRSDAVR